MLVRLTNMNLPPPFGVNTLEMGFCCGYSNAPILRPSDILDRGPGTYTPPYLVSPPYIRISPWETHIRSSTNPYMIGNIKIMGLLLKPYFCKIYKCIHPIETPSPVVSVTRCSGVWPRMKILKNWIFLKYSIKTMLVTCLIGLKVYFEGIP